jgi:hypothetical protein
MKLNWEYIAMHEIIDDPPDFTDEELRQALMEIGEEARRESFAAGLPVAIFKNGRVVLQYADGREEIVPPHEAENGKRARP